MTEFTHGSLNDWNHISMFRRACRGSVFRYQDDKKNNLNDRTKSSFNQNARNLGHLPSEFLACETKQICCRNQADITQCKNPHVRVRGQKVENDSDGNDRPQNVDILGDFV
jgi:hypothetical protein